MIFSRRSVGKPFPLETRGDDNEMVFVRRPEPEPKKGQGGISEPIEESVPVGDGVIGSTDAGSNNVRAANAFFCTQVTPTTAGNVSYGHVYIANGSSQGFTLGIYDDSGNILAYGNANGIAGPGWLNIALNTTVEISEGTSYRIGVVSNDPSWNLYNDLTETGARRQSYTMTYGTTLSNFDFGGATPAFDVADQAFTIIFNNDSGDPA